MCAWTASTKDDEEPPTSKGAFASAAFGSLAEEVSEWETHRFVKAV